MKKIMLLLFIGLCFLQGFSQNQEYTRLKGSSVSLIIPKDFVESERFVGIINPEDNSSLLVFELDSGSDAVTDVYSRENLAKKNIKFISKTEVTVDKKKGILIEAEQVAFGQVFSKLILVLVDQPRAAVFNCTFIKKRAKVVEPKIRNILTNLRWNPGSQVSTTEGLGFAISETEKLKISRSFSKNLLLTLNGSKEAQPIDKPMFVISTALSDVLIADKKVFSENRTKKYDHVSEVEIIESNPIEINGLDGFETIFVGKDLKSKTKMYNYQVVLFNQSAYFLMIGIISFENKDSYVEDFKSIAKSFRLSKSEK